MKNIDIKSVTRQHLMVLTVAFSFIFLTSCEKDPDKVQSGPYDTVIEGYMTERGTGNPIEGIQIDLFGPATKGPRKVVTDENGFYRFELGMQDDSRRFYVDFYGSNWYYNWPGEHYATKQGYNRIDGQLFAAGWVNLHIKNVNHWNGDDTFYFINGTQYIYKGYWDTNVLIEMPANEPRVFTYHVTRRGENTMYQDTLYPIGHDTINYEILY
jgi:hypothetical protein